MVVERVDGAYPARMASSLLAFVGSGKARIADWVRHARLVDPPNTSCILGAASVVRPGLRSSPCTRSGKYRGDHRIMAYVDAPSGADASATEANLAAANHVDGYVPRFFRLRTTMFYGGCCCFHEERSWRPWDRPRRRALRADGIARRRSEKCCWLAPLLRKCPRRTRCRDL